MMSCWRALIIISLFFLSMFIKMLNRQNALFYIYRISHWIVKRKENFLLFFRSCNWIIMEKRRESTERRLRLIAFERKKEKKNQNIDNVETVIRFGHLEEWKWRKMNDEECWTCLCLRVKILSLSFSLFFIVSSFRYYVFPVSGPQNKQIKWERESTTVCSIEKPNSIFDVRKMFTAVA